jgi:hypothetical protein
MADESLQTEIAARIDPICQAFEAALQRGDAPELAPFLAMADFADREALRIELLEIERQYRRKSRETTEPVASTADCADSVPLSSTLPYSSGS